MLDLEIDVMDAKSILEALNKLEAYKKSLSAKDKKIEGKLAASGAHIAQTIYSGIDDKTLQSKPHVGAVRDAEGVRIEASGKEVGFAEFGTGINNPEWGRGKRKLDYHPPAHGTYGKKLGANKNGWYYKGKKTYGLVASEAMLTARDEVISKAVQTIREVYAND